MENQTKPKPLASPMAKKLILAVAVIVFIGTVLGVAGFLTTKPKPIRPPGPQLNRIEISADKKSILNAETKAIIFTIDDAKKYLKDSGYEYNPDTFQNTNAKYEGDCFTDAALSNRKGGIIKNTNNSAESRIVFSTGCLSGDLPQAWVGVYYFGIKELMLDCSVVGKSCIDNKQNPVLTSVFQFLIGGSGRNFAWSSDDKTITYEADLGLSGMTETRIIDSQTGEVLDRKGAPVITDSIKEGWKRYVSSYMDFSVEYPANWEFAKEGYIRTGPDENIAVSFRYDERNFQDAISEIEHEIENDPAMKKENIAIAGINSIEFKYNPKSARMITEPDIII